MRHRSGESKCRTSVFDPFYNDKSVGNDTEGTMSGIGTGVVDQLCIVQSFGGEISRAQIFDARGCMFSVTFGKRRYG